MKSLHSFTSCLEVYTLYSYTVWMILSHPKTTLLWKLHTEGSNTLRGLTARTLHTRVEPVGRVAKMNWLNYDMGMKIHAICDAKNAILKYFSLDMWKFAQIWAFFSCTENFSKTKSPKKCFYSIIAQKNLNANFWKHVILIKSQFSLHPYDEKKFQFLLI